MNRATHILATDLDGTLVGDSDALTALLNFYEEQPYDVSLIYITGRHYGSALSLIEDEQLPVPDVLITDVGTEIRIGKAAEKDKEWDRLMSEDWNLEDITRIASTIDGLTSQHLPVTCRASYTVERPEPVAEFEQKLKEANIAHKLIFSSGRDVDILPAKSGKGEALTYILRKYNLEQAKVLVAGDSGNDVEMLTLGYPSVIVGNAGPELLKTEKHPMIFRSTRACAGGIHEAWNYFHT